MSLAENGGQGAPVPKQPDRSTSLDVGNVGPLSGGSSDVRPVSPRVDLGAVDRILGGQTTNTKPSIGTPPALEGSGMVFARPVGTTRGERVIRASAGAPCPDEVPTDSAAEMPDKPTQGSVEGQSPEPSAGKGIIPPPPDDPPKDSVPAESDEPDDGERLIDATPLMRTHSRFGKELAAIEAMTTDELLERTASSDLPETPLFQGVRAEEVRAGLKLDALARAVQESLDYLDLELVNDIDLTVGGQTTNTKLSIGTPPALEGSGIMPVPSPTSAEVAPIRQASAAEPPREDSTNTGSEPDWKGLEAFEEKVFGRDGFSIRPEPTGARQAKFDNAQRASEETQPAEGSSPVGYRGYHRRLSFQQPESSQVKIYVDGGMGQHGIGREHISEEDIDVVLNSRTTSEIINNNGTMTFLVHSSTPDKAEIIFQKGLGVPENFDSEKKPHLVRTALMLAGPSFSQQIQINTMLMAYRYVEPTNSAKFLLAFPERNPNTWNRIEGGNLRPYDGTFLDGADGKYLTINTDPTIASPAGILRKYKVLPQWVAGYFDLEKGRFVHNPQFFLNVQRAKETR